MASPTAPPPRPPGLLHNPWREGALQVFAGSDKAATCGRRFKNGISRPPPGPRRTPDHPPYAEMIRVALGALAEGGGSTVDAISRRIAAIYLDLPWAHKRLLPHYLGRLVAAGDVAVAAPGRYALLSASPAPAGGSNPDPNLNPSSQAAPCAVNPDDPKVSADSRRRSSSHSSASPANASALDNGEGEGLGAQTLALTVRGDSFGGSGDSQCHRSSMPAAAATHGGDDVSLFVSVPTSAAAFAVGQNERPLEENRPSDAVSDLYTCSMESKGWGNSGGDGPRLRRKGRVRPPKGSRDHWQPASGTHISGASPGGILLSEYGTDRPPEFKTLTTDVQERLPVSGPSAPPKCKPTVVKSDAIPANDNVHLLNCSSSRDPNHMEPSGDVCLHRSLGDVSSSDGDKVVSANCGAAAPKLKLILRLPRKPANGLAKESTTPVPSSLAEQVSVHVPKRPRTSMERKPRKISTRLFEETMSCQPLNQCSEQIVYALPAIREDSSQTNIVGNRPQIKGLVQVLLAVQPKSSCLRQAKAKKSRRCQNESEMVQPVEQFRPDNLLLTRSLEDVAQNDARLETSMTSQSHADDVLQGNVEENRAEMESCMQLISAISTDHNSSLQVREEENQRHAGRYDKSMCNAPYMEGQNVAHDTQDRQTLPIRHSVLDDSLQTGDEGRRIEVGACVESLPSEQFISADSLQISKDNAESMGELMQLPVAALSTIEDCMLREEATRFHAGASETEPPVEQLMNKEVEIKPQDKGHIQEFPVEQSKPEDDLQAGEMQRETEKIRLHSEECVPEPLVTQSVNKELVNEPQDEGSIQEFPKMQSISEDDLQAVEVNESDSKRCLLMHFKFGDDLQTEDKNEPPSVAILLATTEGQCVLGNSLQSLEVENSRLTEESIQEFYVQNSQLLDDLQAEKEKSEVGNCMKVLSHEQAKLQNDLPLKVNKNGIQDLGCTVQSSLKEPSNIYSPSMHQLQEGSHDKLSNRELSVELRSHGDGLQTDCNNGLYGEKHEVLHEEQAKLGANLLGKADVHGRYDEEYMQAFQDKALIHGSSFQDQELEKRIEDEEFAQVIPMELHPAENYLQRKGCLDSHADEHREVSPQEQHKPGNDLQMDGSMAHVEGLAFQLSLEKSVACVSMQMSVSENSTDAKESIEDLSSKLFKPEEPLRMKETYELHKDGSFKGPGTKQSKTCDPLQLKGQSKVLFKKNKKQTRRLWYES